ncbi:biogenesis of lysosome-related organelles complex 1 subunit 2-like [Oscarella lobularis]|uniref:biogenesis of lysosome-related organelles complex 1 subunit 2-like n=1 Tax=Oscarella lobularis TaxID=121494 RepID=UPI0033143735
MDDEGSTKVQVDDSESKDDAKSEEETAEACATEDESHRIFDLCEDMFEKAAAYLRGELSSTADEYQLLERLNRLTIAKYADMANLAENLSATMTDVNHKYQNLEPYLTQVEQLEQSVTALEQAAYKLDAYSKRLEAKFKQLERR